MIRFSRFFHHTGYVCITPQLDCGVISATMNPVIPTHKSDPASPNIGSFVTSCTPPQFHSNSDISSSFSSKLDPLEAKLCDKIMAMKSFLWTNVSWTNVIP